MNNQKIPANKFTHEDVVKAEKLMFYHLDTDEIYLFIFDNDKIVPSRY